MDMKEAAARLERIIKRLGGGTSTTDQAELDGLLADMKAEGVAPDMAKRKSKKQGAKKTMAPAPPPAAEQEKVTKAKRTTKAKGK